MGRLLPNRHCLEILKKGILEKGLGFSCEEGLLKGICKEALGEEIIRPLFWGDEVAGSSARRTHTAYGLQCFHGVRASRVEGLGLLGFRV